MRDVWQYYEEHQNADRAHLTAFERGVLAVCDLRQDVNSGGFDSYFRYGGGDTARDALRALPDSLGDSWAALLTEAMSIFGEEYPTNRDERERALDAAGVEETLDDLAARYFVLEGVDDADAKLTAYLDRGA
jgi:hypothetical protein